MAADPNLSPLEPPMGVTAELLWRVAARLHRDHEPRAGEQGVRCRRCRQPWPCSGRRLAELGLISASP